MADIPTNGQMLWKLEGDDRVLLLRHNDSEPWRPYEEFPDYALPDPAGFSKGITTFLALLKQNWTVSKS
ncbi:MAG: hypothetical protein NZ772_12550 [Cyanobacteria bacterium]|nr:hypothetical protein [Cyanobacteriota bacterium]